MKCPSHSSMTQSKSWQHRAGEAVGNLRILMLCWWEGKMAQPFCKKTLLDSYQVQQNRCHTTQRSYLADIFPREKVFTQPTPDSYTLVPSRSVPKSEAPETTQMPIDWGMVNTQWNALLQNPTQQATGVDTTQINLIKEVTKFTGNSRRGKTIAKGSWFIGYLGLEVEGRHWLRTGVRELRGRMKIFYIFLVVVFTQLQTFFKTHWTDSVKIDKFYCLELYLNKAN